MRRHSLSAVSLIGFSLGGLLDGIVLHQILGWHHLICRTETCLVSSVEALQRQNTEDGFFHLVMWLLTLCGVFSLARAPRQMSFRSIAGALLFGWGSFNFIEGVIDHEILGLHHVFPRSPHHVAIDLIFLAFSLAAIVVGYFMHPRQEVRPA